MKTKIKTLQIIHFTLLIGVTVAYFILGDLLNINTPKLEGENLYYMFIPAIAVLTSNILFKNYISKINKTDKPELIISNYQTASLIRWAILEAGAFIILILKPELIVFGLLLLLYLLLVRPTKEKIERELNISL